MVTTATVDPKNKDFAGELVDLAPYMFQELKVYLNDDDQVVYVKGTNSLVVEGKLDEVTENSEKTIVTVAIENADGKIQKAIFKGEDGFKAADDIEFDIFENGAMKTKEITFGDLKDTETIKIVADDKDGNGKIADDKDTILGFVLTQQTKVAQIEKEYIDGKTKIDVFSLPKDGDDVDLDAVTVTGAVDSLEEIEIDDIVVEYKSDDDAVTKLAVSRDTVDGEITRIDGKNFYIDGKKYTRNSLISTEWELGDEGTFFLDHNGKIVEFEGTSGPTSYAVIVGSADGAKKDARIVADGKEIDKYPIIKLATQDNETITYDVAVTLKDKGENIKSSAKLDKDNLVDKDLKLSEELPEKGVIVKYTIDGNKRISKISTVDQSKISYKDVEKLVFASNAIVFDAFDDYAVASIGRLKDESDDAVAVYNSSGEIVVLLTKDVKAGTDTTFAYISKVNPARVSGDDVQFVEAYMNGEKVGYYTDDDDTVATSLKGKVAELELDGEEIVEAEKATAYATSTTASAVYAKSSRIVLGEESFYLADDATIITIEKDDDIVLSDLNDIEKGTTEFDIYLNTDDEVAFIVIYE